MVIIMIGHERWNGEMEAFKAIEGQRYDDWQTLMFTLYLGGENILK